MSLHTKLGANGTIAYALIPLLDSYHEKIRLLLRDPNIVNGAEIVVTNLLESIAYLKWDSCLLEMAIVHN